METSHDNMIPADVMADIQAVSDAVASGKLVDPEVARRVRERSMKAQEELLRQNGIQEMAVELIRAIRDEE